MWPSLLASAPLLLLLCAAPPAAAQSVNAAPYAPVIIVALVLALMAAALLVVAIVICHFTSFQRRAVSQRRRRPEPPSTVPKKSVKDGGRHRRSPEEQQYQNYAVPDEIDFQVQMEQSTPPPQPQPQIQIQSALLSMRQSHTDMRDTASQFLEFLSHKWNLEQAAGLHGAKQRRLQQQQQPSGQTEMTTFKAGPPKANAGQTSLSARIQATGPSLSDEYYDSCEQDVGQYDNLAQAAPGQVPMRGEADRYEAAMDLRDTRRSNASTPVAMTAISARDVELSVEVRRSPEDDTLRSGQSVEWFEEASAAL